MADDRAGGHSAESQQHPRETRMTTAVDSSHRTDPRVLGLSVSGVLLVIAASVHLSGEYTAVETASILALVPVIAIATMLYHILR